MQRRINVFARPRPAVTKAAEGGLNMDSVVLLNHIRAVDKRRLHDGIARYIQELK